MAARQIDQTVGEEWGGDRNVASAVEVPDSFAGDQVVSGYLAVAVADDLLSIFGCHDQWRRPGGDFTAAIDASNLITRLEIQDRDKVGVQAIALNDDQAVMNNRGTCKAPFERGGVVGAGDQLAEIAFPDQLPVEVETIQTLRCKKRNHKLTIGRRTTIYMGRLQMSLDGRLTDTSLFRPENLPCFKLQAKDLPCPFAGVLRGLPRSAGPTGFHGRIFFVSVDRRCEEHAIAPHDRCRVTQTWYGCFPRNVFSSSNIPFGGRIAAADSETALSSKLRPVVVCADGRRDHTCHQHRDHRTNLHRRIPFDWCGDVIVRSVYRQTSAHSTSFEYRLFGKGVRVTRVLPCSIVTKAISCSMLAGRSSPCCADLLSVS